MKNIIVLGSTGSIGTSTLDVVARLGAPYRILALSANRNTELFLKQVHQFKPRFAAVLDPASYEILKPQMPKGTQLLPPEMESLTFLASLPSAHLVVNGLVGAVGFQPLVAAIKAGKTIALANKETLVVAGELVTRLVQQHHAAILPVDSEHGAIFQCLVGENADEVEKIILTASGGPFRNKSCEELASVTAKDALRHPTWQMGAKITIDSASLMNKGFEVIEAKWLFGLRPEQIDVVIHPQSIIHSMVQYRDGSIKAQLGVPDMRLPIEYALTFPQRRQTNFERLDFTKCSQLTFEQPDPTRFRNLALAFEAMRCGGNMPCALNAANEIAVDAFLHERIGFLQMSNLIETVLERTTFIATPSYNDYVACDTETRQLARELIAHYS